MLDDILRHSIKNAATSGAEKSLKASVKKSLAKHAATSKPEVLIEAGVAETVIPPSRNYVQQQLNRYRPGAGPLRANRATSRKPAHSTIFSESESMKKAYPNDFEKLQGEIESWIRGGYAYAGDKSVGTIEQPMKGYPRYIGPDGKKWRLKSKAKFGQGYRLSTIDTKKLQSYGAKRSSRENPWTNEDEMEQLMKALTKGHLVSLDDGGIDVAENFVPQLLRNTRQKIDGKWIVVKGNAAMQADSTDLLVGEGIASWDEYVRLKLSQL